jgi:hypothetical protein
LSTEECCSGANPLAAGFDHQLVKPAEPDAVRSLITSEHQFCRLRGMQAGPVWRRRPELATGALYQRARRAPVRGAARVPVPKVAGAVNRVTAARSECADLA